MVLSAASTSLLAAVIVTSPVLVIAPAAIVSVVLVLSAKSELVAGDYRSHRDRDRCGNSRFPVQARRHRRTAPVLTDGGRQ